MSGAIPQAEQPRQYKTELANWAPTLIINPLFSGLDCGCERTSSLEPLFLGCPAMMNWNCETNPGVTGTRPSASLHLKLLGERRWPERTPSW